jgi:hypothetical protein
MQQQQASTGGAEEPFSLPMLCPFLECQKEFRHSGNLKTHMRSHVSKMSAISDSQEIWNPNIF